MRPACRGDQTQPNPTWEKAAGVRGPEVLSSPPHQNDALIPLISFERGGGSNREDGTVTYRGDRKTAGETKAKNAKARRVAEKEAEEEARKRLAPFEIDRPAVFSDMPFGDFDSTSKMLRLFTAYPTFVMAQLAEDPMPYLLGDKEGRRTFVSEADLHECREILGRCSGALSPELVRSCAGVLGLWEEGYADEGLRRRLRGEQEA